jgi:hypothetical protein
VATVGPGSYAAPTTLFAPRLRARRLRLASHGIAATNGTGRHPIAASILAAGGIRSPGDPGRGRHRIATSIAAKDDNGSAN